jgi:hypothetical protein
VSCDEQGKGAAVMGVVRGKVDGDWVLAIFPLSPNGQHPALESTEANPRTDVVSGAIVVAKDDGNGLALDRAHIVGVKEGGVVLRRRRAAPLLSPRAKRQTLGLGTSAGAG